MTVIVIALVGVGGGGVVVDVVIVVVRYDQSLSNMIHNHRRCHF